MSTIKAPVQRVIPWLRIYRDSVSSQITTIASVLYISSSLLVTKLVFKLHRKQVATTKPATLLDVMSNNNKGTIPSYKCLT